MVVRNSTGAHIGGARRLDQRQAVHAGQHAVDDHDVVLLAGREIEPVVVGLVDDMAVLAQALGDVVGGLLVVFDEEDLHGLPVRPALVAGPFAGIPAKNNVPQLYKHSI